MAVSTKVRLTGPPTSIAALDSQRKYVSNLATRTAMYTELRLLLDPQTKMLSSAGYRDLVVRQNALSRSSSSAREKLWAELRKRYLLDLQSPLFEAFWTEWRQCESEQEKGLTSYILFALNDRVVADLGTDWLYPYLRNAPAEIRVPDVRSFIDLGAKGHPEVKGWSDKTRTRMAQHYMASIRDFGLALGRQRKTTVRPRVYGSPMRLLIRALQLARIPPIDALKAKIFRLLALDSHDVIDALGELNRLGELTFRIQGDVVELDIRRERM